MKNTGSIPSELTHVIKDATPSALRLLITLSFFMDTTGRAWPSRRLIKSMTGMSTKSIMRARNELSKWGLTWQKRPNRSTIYMWDLFGFGSGYGVDSPVQSGVDSPVQSGVDKIVQFQYMNINKEVNKRRGLKFETVQDRTQKARKILGI